MPRSFRLCFALCFCLPLSGCAKQQDKSQRPIQKGESSHHGGTATVRKPYPPQPDDPTTDNDESNDQPLGHFGEVTLLVYNVSSGHEYTLDADVEDGQVQRLYFPKGGWVDFDSGQIDHDGYGDGTDETGRLWEFRGRVRGSFDSEDEDPSDQNEEEEDP